MAHSTTAHVCRQAGIGDAARVAAFVLRALLAAVTQDGENLRLFITYEILYNVGFFGLLYSAYTLVIDRSVRTPM